MGKKKNIFLLPTDKSSRLYLEYGDGDLCLANNLLPQTSRSNNQNVHITSDEKIKQYDWCLNTKTKNIFQATFTDVNSIYAINPSCKYEDSDKVKKIILTTDQSLKGVQSIDNEFLNWFVKNPNCENIKVDEDVLTYECRGCGGYYDIMSFDHIGCHECYRSNGYSTKGLVGIPDKKKFTIIIPQEEHKKIYEMPLAVNDLGKTCVTKQETLEEAAQRYAESNQYDLEYHDEGGYQGIDENKFADKLVDFTNKFQSEIMYSQEEVFDLFQKYFESQGAGEYQSMDFEEWFDQFKKK